MSEVFITWYTNWEICVVGNKLIKGDFSLTSTREVHEEILDNLFFWFFAKHEIFVRSVVEISGKVFSFNHTWAIFVKTFEYFYY